jgi:lipid II:glycine glycyltransferase (peptidoglycan interpeptide bridge formation enzyme)
MQLRRLSKCQKAGFVFQKAETNIASAAIWHSFIAKCRVQQGLEVNISLGDLELAIESLPELYDFFGVWDGTKLIAATVIVHVSDSVVYNYLPASTKAYNHYSPMVMLMNDVVTYYKKQRLAYLDLGVSSINGIAQSGLCAFKESMGAVRSAKNYFEIGN